ncbi:BtrH N-terminal domain-containing protein, partial [Clostridium perfringens]|uniref:BtrH N-terminal domain-containing protein n=1 Tax=Clostridium perfringens TaxID=1502 RepID=UPI002ACC08BB
MDFPFIGGRAKTDTLTTRIATRLNLTLNVQETTSIDKAKKNVQSFIERGIPVALKLDSYYLDYFTSKVHFAGHYAGIYGMDGEYAYMADTRQQGGLLTTRLDHLAKARNAKGPMSSRNRSFTVEPAGDLPPMKPAVRSALAQNAQDYLNPPIRNAGNKGII